MFVPPTLEYYPQLITAGPLAGTVRQLLRSFHAHQPSRGRVESGVARYNFRRLELQAQLLAAAKLGWCDACRQLVSGDSVRVVYRHGSYTAYKTDCSYGPAFAYSAGLAEVMSLCSLHSESTGAESTIFLDNVKRQGSHLWARQDGELRDVSEYDRRQDPSFNALLASSPSLAAHLAQNVPPRLELSSTWKQVTLQMHNNPYVTLASRSRDDFVR